MTSGGTRLRSGPPPDPNALRREKKSDGEWTTLPSEGRVGALPEWPLPDQLEREAVLWDVYWRKPQAILWERNHQELEVALHVRRLVEVEKPDAPTNLGTLVRQQMDALLLTIPAMLAARITIATDEVKAKRDEREAAPTRASSRDRLRAIDGGA